jgi:hypothetical protein
MGVHDENQCDGCGHYDWNVNKRGVCLAPGPLPPGWKYGDPMPRCLCGAAAMLNGGGTL